MRIAVSTLGLLMMCVAPAAPADRHGPPRVDGPPMVQVSRAAEGGHVLDASFAVAASPEIAWQVLTDYAGLPAFVESLKRSVVVRGPDGLLQVEQEGAGRFGFVSQRFHVLLTIHENASKDRLDFHDTCGESFHRYRGAWTVEPRNGVTLVTYRLEAHPRFFAPGPLASRASKSNVRSLLDGVRSEMARRARCAKR